MVHVVDKLYQEMDEKQSPLVIGLDPNLDKFPAPLLQQMTEKYKLNKDSSDLDYFAAAAEAIKMFNFAIIDATADLVAMFKPQSAYYEQYGHLGIKVLEETAAHIRSKGCMADLDAKRNDIGPTSAAYAEAHLGEVTMVDGTKRRSLDDFDFITTNAYLGSDGIKPFTKVADRDNKGIFVLAKTSNPGSGELQDLVLEDGKTVYAKMGELINQWGESNIGERNYSNVGAVVGATHGDQAAVLRKLLKHVLFLMPGYGAQGGKADILVAGFNEDGYGAVVNSSRGITYAFADEKFLKRHPRFAGKPEMFAEAARQSAIDSVAEINGVLHEKHKLPAGWKKTA